MSKKTFSEKISESMYKKIKAIEYGNINAFLEKDENFEIALCLSYMTLSKEKIIEKDMKNNDRMSRLSQMVDTSEIDKVFKVGFAEEMPVIFYAKENNNLWILDNIRDSIMHGVFDVDENRKCFVIDNQQYDRELKAEIPFSWFIAYAKNDILSKKVLDNYTIRGFYYNKTKKNIKKLNTRKELMNNILYRVNISGNMFNVRDIENRIKELFSMYSEAEITADEIEKYRTRIDSEKIKYNEKYLVSFYIASEKVKDCIEKEFTGVNLDIFIDNRKNRFVNKTAKRLLPYYYNYDIMYNDFNRQVSSKGMSLLRYITNIIESIDTNNLENANQPFDIVNLLNILLNNESIKHTDYKDIRLIADYNLKTMRSICVNVYGLSTLVINHENLYNDSFFNQHPSLYGIHACQKSSYLEYAQKRKSLIMKILDTEISLFTKQQQFNNCPDNNIKTKIQIMINNLISKKSLYESELYKLSGLTQYERIIKPDEIDYKQKAKMENLIDKYFNHFYAAKSVTAKKKLKKVISGLLDNQIEEESKYTYGYCNNMKEVLTIIRNCFSHIGRVSIGKNRETETIIYLNDYDGNGKTGEVICKYIDLIELLRAPYIPSVKNNINTK